jgi:hypothetical protein
MLSVARVYSFEYTDEKLLGILLEGNGPGLMAVLSRNVCVGAEVNHDKFQSG